MPIYLYTLTSSKYMKIFIVSGKKTLERGTGDRTLEIRSDYCTLSRVHDRTCWTVPESHRTNRTMTHGKGCPVAVVMDLDLIF